MGVLEGDRQAVQRTGRCSRGQPLIRGRGGPHRALGVERDDGVDPRVGRRDPVQVGLQHLAGRHRTAVQQAGELGRVAPPEW
jgi:hypothetical protein